MADKIYVYCQTRFIGFHRWPEAFMDVEFLRYIHRHEFHVKVTVQAKHNNRQVEFITLKEHTNEIFTSKDFKSLPATYSCETYADFIIGWLISHHNYNVHSVEVSEDGENGAIVICQ